MTRRRVLTPRRGTGIRAETFPELSKISGFINASMLRRNVRRGVEFLIVTTWESIEAIEQFAGRDSEIAVVPEQVQQMMLEYDRWACHDEVLTHAGHSACSSYAMFA